MAPISTDGRKLQDACTSAGCLVHSNLFSALPGHHELKARCDSWGGVPVIYWGPVYLWLTLPKPWPFPYNVPKVACIAFRLPPWFLSAPRPSPCFQLFASLVPFGDCFLCDLEKGLPVAHWFYQRVFPFTMGTQLPAQPSPPHSEFEQSDAMPRSALQRLLWKTEVKMLLSS